MQTMKSLLTGLWCYLSYPGGRLSRQPTCNQRLQVLAAGRVFTDSQSNPFVSRGMRDFGTLLPTERVTGVGLNSQSLYSISKDLSADTAHDFSLGNVYASRRQKALKL